MRIKLLKIVTLLTLLSCSSYDLGKQATQTVSVNTEDPGWNNGIQELLKAKCDSCHSTEPTAFTPENAKPYAYGFATGEIAFKTQASTVRRVVFLETDPKKIMPVNYGLPLSTLEKTALLKYLDKVSPVSATPVLPATTTFLYADAKPILDAKCVPCHKAGGQKPSPLLDSLAGVRAFTAAATLSRTIDGSMPRKTSASTGTLPSQTALGDFIKTADGIKLLTWLNAGQDLK